MPINRLIFGPQEISDRDEVSHDAAAKQTNSRRVVRREYYEERLEREQCERHAIVTRQYCKAKKNFLALQKQISTLTRHGELAVYLNYHVSVGFFFFLFFAQNI